MFTFFRRGGSAVRRLCEAVDPVGLVQSRGAAIIDSLQKSLGTLSTGRPSPSLLDAVVVEAHGCPQQLRSLARITVRGGTEIIVEPYDSSTTDAVLRAVRREGEQVGLGFATVANGPTPDSQLVRVPVPPATPETRRLQTRRLSEIGESARQSLRRARREAMDLLAGIEKEGGKDEKRRVEKGVEDAVEEVRARIAGTEAAKQAEIGDPGEEVGDAPAAGGGGGKKKGKKGKKNK